VYQHPATPFVYEFLGDVNLFQAASTPGRMKLTCIATLPSRALSRPRSSIAPRVRGAHARAAAAPRRSFRARTSTCVRGCGGCSSRRQAGRWPPGWSWRRRSPTPFRAD